jgi:hypothetical protein
MIDTPIPIVGCVECGNDYDGSCGHTAAERAGKAGERGAQKEGLVSGAQYIRSCFGRKIDLRDPWSTTIDIREIAHALSRICRFGAHLYPGQFYSVAAHSVMVSRLVPPHLAAAGLLHDASEAYLGSDIPKPLKDMIPEYRRIEGPWHKRIQEFYGIKLTPGAIVAIKAADDIAYATEKRDLMAPAAYEIGASDRDEIQAAPGHRCNGSKSHDLQRLDFLERAVELGIPGV